MMEKRLTNEVLETLGKRFVENCTGQILHITFEQYIENPDHFDKLTDRFYEGCGICLHPTQGPKAINSVNAI